MHAAAYAAVDKRLRGRTPRVVVELGSRDVNGSVRPLFNAESYVGVDRSGGPAVDVVEDAATFVPLVAPDCVVCCEVLEHAEEAEKVVKNAARMLAPGGFIIVTCASDGRAPHSAIDGGQLRSGEFYRNVSADVLRSWLLNAGLEHVETEHNAGLGDVYAFGVKPSKGIV